MLIDKFTKYKNIDEDFLFVDIFIFCGKYFIIMIEYDKQKIKYLFVGL